MSVPKSVDLTACAREVLEAFPEGTAHLGIDYNDGLSDGSLNVWIALTGITDFREALDHARVLAAASPPVTAHVPPI